MSQLYPFTDPVVALENPPKTIVAGRGCFVTDSNGKTYLDAVDTAAKLMRFYQNARNKPDKKRLWRGMAIFMDRAIRAQHSRASAIVVPDLICRTKIHSEPGAHTITPMPIQEKARLSSRKEEPGNSTSLSEKQVPIRSELSSASL
jgi:hypothetical protein